MNLKSTVNKMGKQTQVFHFEGNVKLTYEGIMPETIKEGTFTKVMCEDGRMLMINANKLLLVEIFSDEDKTTTTSPNYEQEAGRDDTEMSRLSDKLPILGDDT